jgi:O-antigen/teichoic acid export membrane protein
LPGIFSLLLLPLLLRQLPVEKVALWFIFLTIGSISSLAEQSLEPAITRYITYARGGVRELPKYGTRPGPARGQLDQKLVEVVVASARWLHVRSSVLNLVLLGTGGGMYLWLLASQTHIEVETLTAWGLFVVAQYLCGRLMVNIPILQGLGRTHEAFQALTLQRMGFLITAIVGIVLMPRLEVIAVSHFVSVVLGLGMARLRVRQLLAGKYVTPKPEEVRTCVRDLVRGSWRLWVTRFGAFLIVKSNLLLVSSFLGLGVAGSLALSMQALEAINLLALTPLFSRLPRLYELRTGGLIQEIKQCVGGVLLIAWVTFCIGSLCLLWLGPQLLLLMGSKSTLLPAGSLALLLVTGFLEMNHSLSATLLLLDNRVPFMNAAVLSGVLIVGLSSLVLSQTELGVLGALAVPFLIQLGYNNWKWPREALRSLGSNYCELVRLGITWRT